MRYSNSYGSGILGRRNTYIFRTEKPAVRTDTGTFIAPLSVGLPLQNTFVGFTAYATALRQLFNALKLTASGVFKNEKVSNAANASGNAFRKIFAAPLQSALMTIPDAVLYSPRLIRFPEKTDLHSGFCP